MLLTPKSRVFGSYQGHQFRNGGKWSIVMMSILFILRSSVIGSEMVEEIGRPEEINQTFDKRTATYFLH